MVHFWERKALAEMTDTEWESLCDQCGKCCLHKLMDEDTEEVYYTNVACSWLNSDTCSCKDYANRFESGEECLKLSREKISEFHWLPDTCSYRLLAEGKILPKWHPLITGDKSTMHEAGESVRNQVVYEIDVINWEDHILNHPDRDGIQISHDDEE
ncbi:YcgN family cysteine cluster protein [Vibrio sp. DW001]|uniref:YcgN family cysteine cluster protein n=1 Tax=Vibrio sp. DW001 TaxID=2912315 RepID=UPI0023B177D4|nr:YcgN family cysteine cluster protein [Vibrio sp. DW001]